MARRVRWTQEQDNNILRFYPAWGPKRLAEKLGVPYVSLKNRAYYLGVSFAKDFFWTERMIAVLQERYAIDGPTKLAEEFGTTPFSVTAKARRLGIKATRKLPPKDFVWTDDMIGVLQDRYEIEGGQVLAKEFGIALDTVRHKAGSLGLHTNAGHVRAGRKRAEKSKSCNIHYFDSWTSNNAYLLGFLFADGSVNARRTVLSIQISTRDEDILHFIREEMKVHSKIVHYTARVDKRGSNIQPQSLLAISSKILCEQLEELGLHPRKTYNDDPFPDVPKEFLADFIRGYFDGDGSISQTKNSRWPVCFASFVGSPKLVTGIRDWLVSWVGMNPNKMTIKQGKTATWIKVAWSAQQDLIRFRDFIYPPGHGFCLERKKQKLVQWLDSKI